MDQLYAVQPLLDTPHMGFFALLIVGGLAGWFAGMATGSRHGIFTNILIGIAGSYIGSSIAGILSIAVRGTLMQLIIAFAGSIILLTVWRLVHPQTR